MTAMVGRRTASPAGRLSPAGSSSRGRLSRAGWSVLSRSGSLAGLPKPPEEYEGLGARLVSEVAASWTSVYQFNIRSMGAHEGVYHYECIFSGPTDHCPVPSPVLRVQFGLAPPLAVAKGPSGTSRPRLLYNFEEDDLRHEWELSMDGEGQWRAAQGQQPMSLAGGNFERFIRRGISEKETVRSRGLVDLCTAFESIRLSPPPALEDTESHRADESDLDSAADFGGDLVTPSPSGQKRRTSRQSEDSESGHPVSATVRANELERKDNADAMRNALKEAGLACKMVPPPDSLAELLSNIFDAADEDGAGELPHYEVAKLLVATLPGFGLELWDIHLLLTSAQESDDGMVECKPFIQAAPEIIQALRKRRRAFRERGLPGVEVPSEAVKHCFSDEVSVTATLLATIFENCVTEDPSVGQWHKMAQEEKMHGRPSVARSPSHASFAHLDGGGTSEHSHGEGFDGFEEKQLVSLRRRAARECVLAAHERVSPQEAQRLLQMLPEDEEGFVQIDEMDMRLEQLRTEALLNALVESDPPILRKHLVLGFRSIGVDETKKLPIWVVKKALLQADQVCLSRLQIHTLLCLAVADSKGDVDIEAFLLALCYAIPRMFDAKAFVANADRLLVEHAEATRARENAELAAFASASRHGKGDGDDDEESAEVEVGPEQVEKTMIQTFTQFSDSYGEPKTLPPHQMYALLTTDPQILTCQLSEAEAAGFAAEIVLDAEGQCAYVEHVKRWVPILFEIRKNQLLKVYVDEYGVAHDSPGEKPFPLLPVDEEAATQVPANTSSKRRSSGVGRRASYSGRDGQSPSQSRRRSGFGVEGAAPPRLRQASVPTDVSSMKVSGAVSAPVISGLRPPGSAGNFSAGGDLDPPPGRGLQRRRQRLQEAGLGE